jgi:hypothetical protein
MLKDRILKLFEMLHDRGPEFEHDPRNEIIDNEDAIQALIDVLMDRQDWDAVSKIIDRQVGPEDNVDSETNLELQDEIGAALNDWSATDIINLTKKLSSLKPNRPTYRTGRTKREGV